MNLTGSIASRVPPAVIKILTPSKSLVLPTMALNSEIIEPLSGKRPAPTSLPVKRPTSGSITTNPRLRKTSTLSAVARSCHISGCIAGTINLGTALARTMFVNKSSARP
ncbi:unannotated protein [freshwater metagenome]|uniref:Unannotated protein n=1 Tax=freshwater metagenome TaxID=449393 RepID=A0A6J6Q1F2_9ZZZZ